MSQKSLEKNTTEPYKLPNGWKWARLGEVCEIIMGQSPPGHTYTNTPGGLPFFQGKADFGEYFPKARIWCTQPIKVAVERDILISVRAPVGPVNMNNLMCCIGRGLAAIRCKDNTNNWFIFWYLRSIEAQIALLGSGSTFGAITRNGLINFQIPLPPLEIQRRIAIKLQELMQEVERARTACEKQLEAVKALPSAYLREVFESEEAKKWERKRLEELFTIQQGAAMSPKRRQGISPHYFLRTLNVMWGKLDLSTLDKMDFTDEEISKLSLKPGDLLICEGGEVGRTAIWKGEIDICLHQNHVHRLRKLKDNVIPEFYMYWMQAAFQVFKLYSGQASETTIPNLSIGKLKSFLVPFPPLSEQHCIATYLQEKMAYIDKLRTSIEKQLETINALPQAILRKAFRGEL